MLQRTCTYLLLLSCFLWGIPAFSQVPPDSVPGIRTLRGVDVIDNRLPSSNPGLNAITLGPAADPLQASSNLGDLLSRETAIFIRLNSPGTLASPALRGTGAAHTAIVWNGFNLQSSMNGQSDLSLVPAMLFDRLSVQQGANAASWGSGAVGGTVFLDNDLSRNELSVQQVAGAWNFRHTGIRAGWSNKRIAVSLRAFRLASENNFPYRNTAWPEHPVQRQVNARQHLQGVLHDIRLQTGKNHYLKGSLWWQEGTRRIPPIMTIPMAAASQYDNTLRAALSWNWYPGNWTLRLRSGAFRENILYTDSLSKLHTVNSAQTYMSEAEAGWQVHPRHRLQAGANYSYTEAHADGYGEALKYQRRQAAFASWRSSFLNERLNLLAALRREWFDAAAAPLTPSVSGNFRFWKIMGLRAQWARTFRIPTLNDLYWIPGGNPLLQPENGTSAEAAFSVMLEKRRLSYRIEAGLFHNNLNNWILWTPGTVFWTPSNVQQVRSRGQEATATCMLSSGFGRLAVTLNAQRVRSEPVAIHSSVNTHTGKQLIYVPGYVWNHRIEYSLRQFRLAFGGTCTGLRYTATDNSSWLPPYYVAQAEAALTLRSGLCSTLCFLRVHNLFNATYQVIAWRPMPLRYWQAGLQFCFQSSNP